MTYIELLKLTVKSSSIVVNTFLLVSNVMDKTCLLLSQPYSYQQMNIRSRLSQAWISAVPLLLVFPLGGVVRGEFEGLGLAAEHGAAVPHAAHHQLYTVPQQGHRGRGASAHH